MDEEKEIKKNKQLEDKLMKEVKNFQLIYSQELLTFNKNDILEPYENKLKVSKIGTFKEKIKKFIEKLNNCI